MSLELKLTTPVWDQLLLPLAPTPKTHSNIWIPNVLALGSIIEETALLVLSRSVICQD
jgi:hypothetical protein